MSSVRSIHPLVGFLAIIWVMTTLYTGSLLSALLLTLILLLYLISSQPLESTRRLTILYLWLVLPPLIVLTIVYGPIDALNITLRLFILASVFTSTLQLMKPTELIYISSRLGIPPLAALTIPIIIRLADYMNYTISETLVALKGRGLSGRKLLTSLPIPLTAHIIISSAQMAEAIAQKQYKNHTKYTSKPTIKTIDILITTYIIANTIIILIQTP
ncbi:MAG: hypothetical protein QXR02_06410 [Acidilobaceae archaeon]